jgi:hypothetical protein
MGWGQPDPKAVRPAPDEQIETRNDFLIGVGGLAGGATEYSFLRPPVHMDRETALRTAAYLVALADPLQERFPVVLAAVLAT